jgi:hypothetical protein
MLIYILLVTIMTCECFCYSDMDIPSILRPYWRASSIVRSCSPVYLSVGTHQRHIPRDYVTPVSRPSTLHRLYSAANPSLTLDLEAANSGSIANCHVLTHYGQIFRVPPDEKARGVVLGSQMKPATLATLQPSWGPDLSSQAVVMTVAPY